MNRSERSIYLVFYSHQFNSLNSCDMQIASIKLHKISYFHLDASWHPALSDPEHEKSLTWIAHLGELMAWERQGFGMGSHLEPW